MERVILEAENNTGQDANEKETQGKNQGKGLVKQQNRGKETKREKN
jgi:hypothetical protein